ncbi:MAG: hypothetical protein ACHQQQ_00085 [Bacteroidota bacterium]
MSVQPSTNAIVDLPAVKSYLKISGSDTTQDDNLQTWINRVSDTIERTIRGPVAAQNFADELHDGDGTSRIAVFNAPLVSLQNTVPEDVMYREDPLDDWVVLEEEIKYIIIKPEKPWHIYLYRSFFPQGTQNIKLCYHAGYESIPGVIIQVCIEAVAEIFKESNQGSGRLGQSSRAITSGHSSGVSENFFQLDDRHIARLAPFVRPMP